MKSSPSSLSRSNVEVDTDENANPQRMLFNNQNEVKTKVINSHKHFTSPTIKGNTRWRIDDDIENQINQRCDGH